MAHENNFEIEAEYARQVAELPKPLQAVVRKVDLELNRHFGHCKHYHRHSNDTPSRPMKALAGASGRHFYSQLAFEGVLEVKLFFEDEDLPREFKLPVAQKSASKEKSGKRHVKHFHITKDSDIPALIAMTHIAYGSAGHLPR